jgi:NWD NACHT NTPase-like protein
MSSNEQPTSPPGQAEKPKEEKAKNRMCCGLFGSSKKKETPAQAPLPPPHPKNPLSDEDDTDISLQLWDSAYNALKEEENTKKLVIDYEIILTKYKNGPTAPPKNMFERCSGKIRLDLMNQITEKSLNKAKSRAKLEATAEVAVKVIDLAKEKVGSMLDAYPPAALAWSGFCTLTPVRHNVALIAFAYD